MRRAVGVPDAPDWGAQCIQWWLVDGDCPGPDSEKTVVERLDTFRNGNVQLAPGIDPASYGIVLDICILRNAELVEY